MKYPYTEFGVKVLSECAKRNITLHDLAKLIGVRQNSLSQYLHGRFSGKPLESKINVYFGWC